MGLCSHPLKFFNKVKYKSQLFIAVTYLVCLSPISTSADVAWENLLQLNPKALSLGNAVSADYVGIDSLQYNPAALVHLSPGLTMDFKLLGAPLLQVIRNTSPNLVARNSDLDLYFRGHTVRCDSSFKPYTDVDIRTSLSSNPNRDPLTGGLDPAISGLNYNIPADACHGPELLNPNGVFANDPLDIRPTDLDRTFPIPLATPFYLPNIAYKRSEDSRVGFAAQLFTNAPLPTTSPSGSSLAQLGLRRLTFTSGVGFKVTDKLSVGAALRVSKGELDVAFPVNAFNQVIGFANALVNDLCTTNESRANNISTDFELAEDFQISNLLSCAELYREHQSRVDSGLARDSGYWPFIPWEPLAEALISGQTQTIYSWNLGVQWKPVSWLTWGATYRTQENDVYDLNGLVHYSPSVISIFSGLAETPLIGAISSRILAGNPTDRINVQLSLPFPKTYSSGVSIQLLEKTKINVEYRKFYYSAWETWRAGLSSPDLGAIGLLSILGVNELPINAGGRDGSIYSYGIEHQWNQRLALRFGYEDRPFLDGDVLPLYNIRLVSIGSEYKLTRDKVIDVTLTSLLFDATRDIVSTQDASNRPLVLARRAAGEFLTVQQDAHLAIFVLKYTHRF